MLTVLFQDKFKLVRIACFVSFLFPMILTKTLWFSNRDFPTVPLFNWLTHSSMIIDVFLLLIFLISFFLFTQKSNLKTGLPIVFIYTIWCLLDQNRIQNFYFELIHVVFILAVFDKNETLQRKWLLYLFVATYFFSGIHKYNDRFYQLWMNGLNNRIPFVSIKLRALFTIAIPFLEAGFGIGLLFVKTRKVAIWLLAIMHGIILVTLLSDAYGYVVFPLNLFNVFVLFLLFYKDKKNVFRSALPLKKAQELIFMILFFALPLLNFVGKFDHILSFSYLTGKPRYARLYIDKSDFDNLPPHIKNMTLSFEDRYYLDFNYWAGKTIKVLVYPEQRVYNNLKRTVEQYTKKTTRLELY